MTAQKNIRSIATSYRGFLFRSRLEAKWAVFFDLCGWKWSYEPVDLNGWIPDFSLGERPTLVEVKPFFRKDEWADTLSKIKKSGCREPVILLGSDATWLGQAKYDEAVQIVWLAYFYEELKEFGCEELHFGETEGNGKLGLCPLQGGWTNYIWDAPPYHPVKCSHPNKWSRVHLGEDDVESELVARWAEACNVSQWVPLCK